MCAYACVLVRMRMRVRVCVRVCVLRDVRVVSMCMSVRVGACLVAHARGREPVHVRVHT